MPDLFETVLGDDFGNFMERRMVLQEIAADGCPVATAELSAMEDRLEQARAATENSA